MNIKIAVIPVIFFLLLLLGAFAALIVGLFVAKPATRRVLLWILGVIILIPAFLFLLLFSVRVAGIGPSGAGQQIVILQSAAEVPSVWQDAIEEQFGAEVYSSPRAAAFGLGKLIADRHRKLLGRPLEIIQDPQTPKAGPVKVILSEHTANMDILEECRNGLKQSLPELEVLIQPPGSSGPSEGQVWILFELYAEKSSTIRLNSGFETEGNSGALRAVIETSGDKFTEQVSYDYRRWIHDMPSFRGQNNMQCLAVYSDTATDLQEAQNQVYEKACSILSESIRASVGRQIDVQRGDLERFTMTADTYTQELKSMTGPVWRFALLLDTDSEKLNQLMQSKTRVERCQQNSWIQMVLSLLGMMVIIWIAYSIANAATKGYYSVLFAILAILAAVIVGLLLFIA
jgi:hypothetical protein